MYAPSLHMLLLKLITYEVDVRHHACRLIVYL